MEALQEWRDKSYNSIKNSINRGGNHLLPILMTLGKTWSAGNLPADDEVEYPITVFTKQIDTREQIEEYAIEAGLNPESIKRLPVFNRWCPTAKGEHDDEDVPGMDTTWSKLMEELQRQLVPPSVIHEIMGGTIPCQHDGKCEYSAACDFDAGDYELLIGHPVHANIQSYVEERAVLFDEDAGGAFEYTVNQKVYTAAISTFLEHHSDIDAELKNDLIRADEEQQNEWIETIKGRNLLVDPDIGYSNQGGRADAPLLTLAVLSGEPVENGQVTDTGLRRAEIGKKVLLHDEGKHKDEPSVTVRNPPEALSSAWATIAMDGTPTPEIWNGRLGRALNYDDDFMTDGERAEFIRDTLGYNIIQLTEEATVFSAKAKNVSRWKFNGFLHEIKDHHDRLVPTITSLQAKESIIHGEYVSNKELHLGKVRSHSELEDETLLTVLGSLHPGDRAIQQLAALDGYAIESNGEYGVDKSYGEIGDRYYHHIVHNEVAQAIFRAGRKDDIAGSDIYVYTACIPDWIPRTTVSKRPQKWSDEIEETKRALKNNDSLSKNDLQEMTGNGERTVRKHLYTLRDLDAVDSITGINGRKKWYDTGIDTLNPFGRFQIHPEE
jgi:hypothetical protein